MSSQVDEPTLQTYDSATIESHAEPSVPSADGRGKNAYEIGTWGEGWVVKKYLPTILQEEFGSSVIRHLPSGFELLAGGSVVARVTWLNWSCEQRLPYDIVVERQSSPRLFVEGEVY